MTVEIPSPGSRLGRTGQWQQALNVLYINFKDYSRSALEDFDDEAIHQARVNNRKLLTLLSILDPSHSTGLYSIFKKAQKRLGKVRDADVLIKSFKDRRKFVKEDGDTETASLLKTVIRHQKVERRKYRHKLARDLPALFSKNVDKQWNEFLEVQLEPLAANRDANVVMRELEVAFDQQKQKCRALMKSAETDSGEIFEALHDLRIAAKELRYTANAAAFALNGKFHANEEIYKKVQEQLGEINDKRVWLDMLNRIGPKELDISRKTWTAFTGLLEEEVEEALRHNEVVQIGSRKSE
ncbi:CHAD domain-containing protein [Paenibacillus sp. sgz500958]|uniref:CHAD domain-containing protein n=1 Tax=Paenibacillus sp. sgz500958 TaxID=3242475 RepID=UPI0036D3A2F6